jgi:hypothetical protein
MGDEGWQRHAGDVADPDTSSAFTAHTAGYVLVFGLNAARASVASQGGEQPPRLATARRPEPAARAEPRSGKQTRWRWLRRSRSSMCAHDRTHAKQGTVAEYKSAQRKTRSKAASGLICVLKRAFSKARSKACSARSTNPRAKNTTAAAFACLRTDQCARSSLE